MFARGKYLLRKNLFNLLGAKLDVFDENGNLVVCAQQKAFKLKEDIRLYSDAEKTDEVMTIKARAIIDFSVAYDLVDSKTGEKFAMIKRKGLRSILKDEWIVADKNDAEIGVLQEDSMALALVRRLLFDLIPQNYDLLVNGIRVADLKQNFNPFIYKLNIDLTVGQNQEIDPRIAIALGVLLAFVEGKQG
ncbi:MAG TPA: hypothetical protein DIC35_01310 [Candidatus Moranbacteria bacterium]|nr:hypothetical protein [Candidatus Moranbacteria bacterium]